MNNICKLKVLNKKNYLFLDFVQLNRKFNLFSFSYYNIHSICIPDLFPNRSDDYWSLSTSIIIFNFVAFLYIAAAYISIYCLTFKNKETVQDNAEAGLSTILTHTVYLYEVCICSKLLRLNI